MTIAELQVALARLPEVEVLIQAGQITLPVRGIEIGYITHGDGMKTVALIIPGEPTT